jgi:hypothetical protein
MGKPKRRNLAFAAHGGHTVNQFPQPGYAVPPVPMAPAPQYPPAAPQVIVQALQAKNASVAKVTVQKIDWNKGWEPEYKFEVSESAKREQGDVYDPLTGELMSQGRAFQRLGREMITEANKRVKADVQARAEAEERKNQPKRPVHRRTREEWEAIQRHRARREEEIARDEEKAQSQFANSAYRAEAQAMWDEAQARDTDGHVTAFGRHLQAQGGRGGNAQLAEDLGLDIEPEEYGHFSSIAGGPNAAPLKGVMSGNSLPDFGLRVNLSDGRYLTVQDGWVVAVVPGQNPVRLVRA